jgi:putative peptidoglycan lipid II flippase
MSDLSPNPVAGNSLTVAAWTVVSRVTGFARAATIAAVLGPTFFANTYQGINLVPNLTYEMMAGSLFASLLVPRMVRLLDAGEDSGAERVARGFLGIAAAGFAVLAVLVAVGGPLVLWAFSAGVPLPEVAAAQRRDGRLLLLMFLPQIVLYAVAGTGGAVLNARGRFALPAAAPALENLGVMATLGLSAMMFGTGRELGAVSLPNLLFLGVGTTAAVVLHAGLLWWGSWRVGVTLLPEAGWRNDQLKDVLAQLRPSLGYAGLNVVRLFTILVVANRVPGGVVAFQLALNFFYFPVAVGARPIAVALLPRLARLHHEGADRLFRDELLRGAAQGLFLTAPAAVALGVLAWPLAHAVAFGEMATAVGRLMIAASLTTLAFGLVGEGGFVIATHASYARGDALSPFWASLVRASIVFGGMLVAFLLTGTSVLVALGISVSLANLVGALHLGARLRARLAPGSERLWPSTVRALAASGLMAVPVWVAAAGSSRLVDGRPGAALGVGLAALAGLVTFLWVQRAWRSPELHSLGEAIRGLRRGPGGRPSSEGTATP